MLYFNACCVMHKCMETAQNTLKLSLTKHPANDVAVHDHTCGLIKGPFNVSMMEGGIAIMSRTRSKR